MQDALKSGLESSLVPAFEMSCKAMFEQVDATFQKGMVEHTSAAQQQFDSTHSPLALALRVCGLFYFVPIFKTKCILKSSYVRLKISHNYQSYNLVLDYDFCTKTFTQ